MKSELTVNNTLEVEIHQLGKKIKTQVPLKKNLKIVTFYNEIEI